MNEAGKNNNLVMLTVCIDDKCRIGLVQRDKLKGLIELINQNPISRKNVMDNLDTRLNSLRNHS